MGLVMVLFALLLTLVLFLLVLRHLNILLARKRKHINNELAYEQGRKETYDRFVQVYNLHTRALRQLNKSIRRKNALIKRLRKHGST